MIQKSGTVAQLERLVALEAAERLRLIEVITRRDRKVRLGVAMRLLAGQHLNIGLLSYVRDHDVVALQQNAFTASQLITASMKEDGGPEGADPHDYFCALLSGRTECALRLASEGRINFRDDDGDITWATHVEALRNCILGEDGVAIDLLADCEFETDQLQFFRLLRSGDAQGINGFLERIAVIRHDGPVTASYLPYEATLLAKVAQLRGFEVKVDALPQDLLNIDELAAYEDKYDFLSAGWPAKRPGILGRLFGRR